jgi:hypothetical protein
MTRRYLPAATPAVAVALVLTGCGASAHHASRPPAGQYARAERAVRRVALVTSHFTGVTTAEPGHRLQPASAGHRARVCAVLWGGGQEPGALPRGAPGRGRLPGLLGRDRALWPEAAHSRRRSTENDAVYLRDQGSVLGRVTA